MLTGFGKIRRSLIIAVFCKSGREGYYTFEIDTTGKEA